MKFLKVFCSSVTVFALLSSAGSTFVSCKKNVYVHDTTIKQIHDTTVKNIYDTTVVRDTIYDLQDGLVAYYNFNSGNLNDSSGHSNNISFNNATKTSDRFGNPNNAYLFDGSSTYMLVPNSESLNPDNITIFAIVKVNGFNTSPCHINQIVGKGWPDIVDGFYDLRFDDFATTCTAAANTNNEHFGGNYGDDIPQGTYASVTGNSVAISTGQWYYVALTYDGLNAKIYVNGQLAGSSQKSVSFTDNTFDLFIGKHQDPSWPYYFNGVIDEIRIYNRALPAGGIAQLNKIIN
ncbi:MAG: hypothetical protein C5B59_01940 [Bacteroidetes bacterium]|nr:MAG: hypothetical protein C5B59_01940 [Bacteroidota bacterium]